MKFIVDASSGTAVADFLISLGHDVISVAREMPTADDHIILEKAKLEQRIVVTNDKDFGELVYRMKMIHSGIILARLEDLKSSTRSQIVFDFITNHETELTGSFIVVQSGTARIRKIK